MGDAIIMKYPVVELKIYPGTNGEAEDIRVMVNQADFPDDITAADFLLKSYTNTANNDANETMTDVDKRMANADYHKHHSEKIYFKPYRRRTAKTLAKSLEKFGIEDYNRYVKSQGNGGTGGDASRRAVRKGLTVKKRRLGNKYKKKNQVITRK